MQAGSGGQVRLFGPVINLLVLHFSVLFFSCWQKPSVTMSSLETTFDTPAITVDVHSLLKIFHQPHYMTVIILNPLTWWQSAIIWQHRGQKRFQNDLHNNSSQCFCCLTLDLDIFREACSSRFHWLVFSLILTAPFMSVESVIFLFRYCYSSASWQVLLRGGACPYAAVGAYYKSSAFNFQPV